MYLLVPKDFEISPIVLFVPNLQIPSNFNKQLIFHSGDFYFIFDEAVIVKLIRDNLTFLFKENSKYQINVILLLQNAYLFYNLIPLYWLINIQTFSQNFDIYLLSKWLINLSHNFQFHPVVSNYLSILIYLVHSDKFQLCYLAEESNMMYCVLPLYYYISKEHFHILINRMCIVLTPCTSCVLIGLLVLKILFKDILINRFKHHEHYRSCNHTKISIK